MKKSSRLLFAAMIIVALAATLFVGCKKEKDEKTTENAELSTLTNDNMDEYLMAFKKKLLSAEKGGETISLEQAERDLGNLLNFDFGDANYATDVFQYDTLHLTINVSNGEVDLSQLAATYNEVFDDILNIYSSVNLPEKSVYAICCDFLETESKNGDEREAEIVVITRGNLSSYIPVHDTFDWRPMNWAGTCDGQFVNLYGAPEILRKWVMEAQPDDVCLNGGRLYYTEIVNGRKVGFDFYDSSTGNYMLFTTVMDDISSVCISHEEMEYYFNNIIYYWNHGWITNLTNHSLLYIHITLGHYINAYLPSFSEPRNCWSWELYIRHGKPNCSNTSPVTPEE